MSEREKKILDAFAEMVKKAPAEDKERMLSFCEGAAFMAERKEARKAEAAKEEPA